MKKNPYQQILRNVIARVNSNDILEDKDKVLDYKTEEH